MQPHFLQSAFIMCLHLLHCSRLFVPLCFVFVRLAAIASALLCALWANLDSIALCSSFGRLCYAVSTIGPWGPAASGRAPDRRAKRKGHPEGADDAAKLAAVPGAVTAQLPLDATAAQPPSPVAQREAKPEPAVRSTSNSSRYRGVTRHRRDAEM